MNIYNVVARHEVTLDGIARVTPIIGCSGIALHFPNTTRNIDIAVNPLSVHLRSNRIGAELLISMNLL